LSVDGKLVKKLETLVTKICTNTGAMKNFGEKISQKYCLQRYKNHRSKIELKNSPKKKRFGFF
jgi:hypothetical protein